MTTGVLRVDSGRYKRVTFDEDTYTARLASEFAVLKSVTGPIKVDSLYVSKEVTGSQYIYLELVIDGVVSTMSAGYDGALVGFVAPADGAQFHTLGPFICDNSFELRARTAGNLDNAFKVYLKSSLLEKM